MTVKSYIFNGFGIILKFDQSHCPNNIAFPRLFIDNIGTYLVTEEAGKLKFQTAAGWPMTLRRNVAPQAAVMQRSLPP